MLLLRGQELRLLYLGLLVRMLPHELISLNMRLLHHLNLQSPLFILQPVLVITLQRLLLAWHGKRYDLPATMPRLRLGEVLLL